MIERAKDCLSYPIRGQGKYVLITGAACAVVATWFSNHSPLMHSRGLFSRGSFPGAVGLAILGFLLLAGRSVIMATSRGDDEHPGWPDVSDFGELVGHGLRTAVLFAVLVLAVVAGDHVKPVLGVIAMLVAAIYFPMAFLNISTRSALASALPWYVVQMILSSLGAYATLMMELALLIAAWFGIAALFSELTGVFFIDKTVVWLSTIYVYFVFTRRLGLFAVEAL